MNAPRNFQTAADLFLKGQIPGFLHVYVGEEAVAAGVMAHLTPQDMITSTHRGHGHAVARLHQRQRHAHLLDDQPVRALRAPQQPAHRVREPRHLAETRALDGEIVIETDSGPRACTVHRGPAGVEMRFELVEDVGDVRLDGRFGQDELVGDKELQKVKNQAKANAEFIAQTPEANRIVHDIVAELGGSISAEHGLGQLKRTEILRYKSPVEMALMRSVKQAIDPQGLMNPGKVL